MSGHNNNGSLFYYGDETQKMARNQNKPIDAIWGGGKKKTSV